MRTTDSFHSDMFVFGRKLNYRRNSETEINRSGFPMICGQALGETAKLKYGLCRMSFNGCEVIAVYNALVYLGIPVPLHETAFYMEKYRMLMGIFGCNPFKIGNALRYFGGEFSRPTSDDFGEAFIITYWTGRRFLSSLHTVFCIQTESGIDIYNRFNSCPTVRNCMTVRDITGGKKPVAVYTIVKEQRG